jgi:hypothetical protein
MKRALPVKELFASHWVEAWVGSPIPPDTSGFLQAPASDLQRPLETFRSLLWGELEMRFGGNPIEGSNPSLSAITLITFPSAG